MNIYLIKARECVNYDSYDGHVVVAYTEHDARRNVPHGDEVGWMDGNKCPNFWTDDAYSSCEQIGTVLPDREHSTGAILSSFNAG